MKGEWRNSRCRPSVPETDVPGHHTMAPQSSYGVSTNPRSRSRRTIRLSGGCKTCENQVARPQRRVSAGPLGPGLSTFETSTRPRSVPSWRFRWSPTWRTEHGAQINVDSSRFLERSAASTKLRPTTETRLRRDRRLELRRPDGRSGCHRTAAHRRPLRSGTDLNRAMKLLDEITDPTVGRALLIERPTVH